MTENVSQQKVDREQLYTDIPADKKNRVIGGQKHAFIQVFPI